jgi:hypothetical protein
MSNWIGLPLSSAPLPIMWNDVAACIACCTLALRPATEVLDPVAGALDPRDGVPLVLELQAAITVTQAMAAAMPRCLRIPSRRCAG